MRTLSEAIGLYEEERYVDAARRLQLVTQFGPDNAEAWMYYGACLGKLGQWDEAVAALERVTALRPDQVSGWCDLAAALIAAGGRRAAAEQALAAAAQLDADDPTIAALRARLGAEPPPPVPAPVAAPATRRQPWRPRLDPRRRLRAMVGVLVALLVVVAVRAARAPGERWRQMRHAMVLLDDAERERALLLKAPGESFDVRGGIQSAVNEAEQTARALLKADARLPEALWLLGRCQWLRLRYGEASDSATTALDRLSETAADQPRASGVDARVLRASLLRLRARCSAADPSPWRRAQARDDLREARQLTADPADAEIEAALAGRPSRR